MTDTKRAKFYQVAIAGLTSANKGNPFWTKSDAFSLLNTIRNK